MDINMPIMDGFKATEALIALKLRNTIICAVTAYVDAKTREEWYN